MTNILVEYETRIASVDLFMDRMGRFERRFGGIVEAKDSLSVSSDDVSWADVLITVRGSSLLSTELVRVAKEQGVFCALLADDNLAEPSPSRITHPQRIRGFLEIAKMADVILCPSARLSERLCALSDCRRAGRINAIVDADEVLLPRARPRGDKTRLVYAASGDHARLFERVSLPALVALGRRQGERLSLTFVGVRPNASLLERFMEVTYIPALSPLAEYRQFMREHRFDIGLSPLESTDFSQFKYFNKLIEYTAMGIAGVYSSVPPYSDVVEDGVTGMLCRNNARDWERAITFLSEEGCRKAREVAVSAGKSLVNTLSEESVLSCLVEDVPELAFFKKPSTEKKPAFFDTSSARSGYLRFKAEERRWLLLQYAKRGRVGEALGKALAKAKAGAHGKERS